MTVPAWELPSPSTTVAYPLTTFSEGSKLVPYLPSELVLVIGSDATIGVRDSIAPFHVFEAMLVHDLIAESDANTLESFYDSNRFSEITVTWNGVEYDCHWIGRPIVRHVRGDRWRAVSELVAVKI